MKIILDNEDVMDLEIWEQNVIKNDIPSDVFKEDIKRRIKWVITHKFDQCFNRLEQEWLPKLREDPRIESIPSNKQGFCEMIFSRADYKDKKTRDQDRLQ